MNIDNKKKLEIINDSLALLPDIALKGVRTPKEAFRLDWEGDVHFQHLKGASYIGFFHENLIASLLLGQWLLHGESACGITISVKTFTCDTVTLAVWRGRIISPDTLCDHVSGISVWKALALIVAAAKAVRPIATLNDGSQYVLNKETLAQVKACERVMTGRGSSNAEGV